MALKGVQLGLRVWQFLWTLLVMALIGNMIASAFSGTPASVNYAMFTSAFSMFTLFYLVPASFNLDWAIHPIIMIIVDLLNCIFFFCAAIVLAARLEVHSCSNQNYLMHNEVVNGSHHRERSCREAQASTAFLWFGWAGYMASVIVSIFMARSSGLPSGGARRVVGRPSMAQV
ncbi:hypothetical protein N7468_004514 [Penicillium chermesinum]|uniref:MARVEL domain-containing protein n=1 Tax=Penicillium chermesinum TaxID=63820 RepID=A0A9W9P8X2_9EURO|nr:uncharacterized protein N7468_004514 [Penicillium chermesinum]KAJ5239895.1 hypothetical protein N7468_004514 [Penicillium chermesinum]KAJ6166771.1 hypothetical protein N7470_002218 [Penicillium chermesinum]